MLSYGGIDILEVMEEAKNYNAFIEDLIQESLKGKSVLDFGAGHGQFAVPVKSRGWDVECVETDAQLTAKLIKKSFKVYSDINAAPLFDSIYSINVLEHIENDQQVAQDMMAHLKPGGQIVIYVPAFSLLYSALDRKIGHHRRYTKNTLRALFPQMTVVQCHYVDSLGFFASLYLKYFGRTDGHLSAKMVRFYDEWLFPMSRALDCVFKPFFGKNVFLVAEKKG